MKISLSNLVAFIILTAVLIFNFSQPRTDFYKNATSPAFKAAFRAYYKARELGYGSKSILVVVDFTKPSTEKRFFVLNMKTQEVIMSTWVAHGSGSGEGDYATYFSNENESHASSLGVFETLSTYDGHNGYSLQIKGLESGYNSNVYDRSIVVHGSDYIGYGRTGHSWGCFAIPFSVSSEVINTIKDGAIIVAYSDHSSWLENSRFLS